MITELENMQNWWRTLCASTMQCIYFVKTQMKEEYSWTKQVVKLVQMACTYGYVHVKSLNNSIIILYKYI